MWTPNTTDAQGRRYSYGNQPYIAQWNLARLAEALIPLGLEVPALEEGLKLYVEAFQARWNRALADKLGLDDLDDALAKDLFPALGEAETDFTIFFRNLAKGPEAVKAAFYEDKPRPLLDAWLARHAGFVEKESLPKHARLARMNAANPKYVCRNYLAVQAIEAIAQGDAAPLERLMRVLRRPYDEQPGEEDLAARRPEWARHKAGCSALSCSS
jgi:uncharacterized protein YdiU (UPF0061 family)